LLTAKALDILRRALLGLVFCFVLPFEALAQSEFDYDAWTKTADRAEMVLDQDWASETALETLRAEISDYRSQFQQEQSANQERITTLKAQIAALGQVPENGTEPQEIASRRADLQKQLDDLEVRGASDIPHAALAVDGLAADTKTARRLGAVATACL
jgi:septal ring factor EnvC (AmiA/AmiB activator)